MRRSMNSSSSSRKEIDSSESQSGIVNMAQSRVSSPVAVSTTNTSTPTRSTASTYENDHTRLSKNAAVDFSRKIEETFNNIYSDLTSLKRRLKKNYPEMKHIVEKIEYGSEITEKFKKVLKEEEECPTVGSSEYVCNHIANANDPDGAKSNFDYFNSPPKPYDSPFIKQSDKNKPVGNKKRKRTDKHYPLRSREVEYTHDLMNDINCGVDNTTGGDNKNTQKALIKELEPFEAFEQYLAYDGLKHDLVKQWSDQGVIPVKKTKFYEMLRIYKEFKKTGNDKLTADLTWPPRRVKVSH